jgi:DNA-binding transcriptional ArsR family regulator
MKALGEENRLRIMRRLLQGPSSVNDLADTLAISAYNVSKHLRILREAGLVAQRKLAQLRLYQVAPEFAAHLEENEQVLNLGCCQFDFSKLND